LTQSEKYPHPLLPSFSFIAGIPLELPGVPQSSPFLAGVPPKFPYVGMAQPSH
jgi:hypothetical protein